MRLFSLSLILLCGALVSTLFAQPQPILRPSSVPTLALPALDNDELLQAELALRTTARAPYFAETRKVNIRPENSGVWTNNPDGSATWRLRVSSPNALSLNLGFTEYWMPAGGELYLHTGKKDNWEVLGPFTPANNATHNELWTPVLPGDELIVEVSLPAAERQNLRLWLTHVNHDFEGVLDGSEKSGSCNLDVVCGAADGWEIVDKYRDIIRSAVTMNLNGNRNCSGVLVNNTAQDGRPYLLTAYHCGIRSGNVASLVVFYNYENSTCRQPNSAASGGNGNGSFATFNNGGAVLRAENPASDMTLVELLDPINPAANAFLAGWDNTYSVPTDTVIAIHFPNTDEKRISFSFQQSFFTNGFNGPNNAAGTHLEIPDWNIGTTEPGSSGSPVYDRFHRVRGQLHGGNAACGNNAYDTYGAIARSWEGGGASSSRLRDWLDPNNTGVTAIDGREVNVAPASVASSPTSNDACGTDQSVYVLTLGAGFTGNITLSIEDLPNGLSASYSQNPVTSGSTVDLMISANSATTGNFNFNVTASDGVNSDIVPLTLNLTSAAPPSPTAVAPAANAVDVLLTPTIDWTGAGGTYEYELFPTAGGAGTFNGTVSTTEFTIPSPLDEGTTYSWRVRETNGCGTGAWSAIRQFTTLKLACGDAQQSADVPVALSSAGSPTSTSELVISDTEPVVSIEVSIDVDHSYVGDLRISLESPDLGTIVLVDRMGYTGTGFGCSGDDLVLIFNDQATNTAADLEATCGDLPAASGTYKPVESMAAFLNQSAAGTWRLIIEDFANGDGGTLNDWSMSFCTNSFAFPVALSAFEGSAKNCSYALAWSSELEENFSHYEVEKSTNGRNFTSLARVEGGRRTYSFTDEFAKGQAYYRLKMVDLDESFTYSDLLAAETECGRNQLVALYPNPIDKSRSLQLNFADPITSETSFTVFGADGRKLLQQEATSNGEQTVSLDVADLPAGTYFLRVIAGGQSEVRSFVKM